MADGDLDYNRFNMKDLLTLVVLPKLESIDQKLSQKADATDYEKLVLQLNEYTRYGSPVARQALDIVQKQDKILDSLVAWRNRLIGAIGIVTAIVGVLTAIVLRYLGI